MSFEARSWPELMGKEATIVEAQLKAQGFRVEIKPEGSPITRDYRLDRVRLFVDQNNVVVKTPRNG